MFGNLGSSFEPRAMLSLIWKRKWLLLVPTIAVTALTYAGSYFVQPKYSSSVIIWMGNPIRLAESVERMLGGGFRDLSGNVRVAVADARDLTRQVTSLAYAGQVMQKLDWEKDSVFTASAQQLAASQPGMSLPEAMALQAAARLRQTVELEVIGANHIRISVESNDPFRARDIAKAVGEVFVEEKSKEEARSLFASNEFSFQLLQRYEKQLQDKRDEKTQLEKDITRSQSGTNRITGDENRTEISSEIERRRQEVRSLQEKEQRLVTDLQKLASADFRLDESNALRMRRQDVTSVIGSFEGLLQDQPWRDMSVINQTLRLAKLQDDIDAEIRSLVDVRYRDYDPSIRGHIAGLISARERIDIANRMVSSLSEALGKIEKRVLTLPEYRARLDELTRAVERAELLRDQFRQQQISYEISQDLVQESRFRVVEDARVEPAPVWPDRMLLLLTGLLGGLFLGGVAVFLVEYSDRSLKDSSQVEAFLGIPVVGLVPRVEGLRK
jgi:uncharacterized protein involved in exopolysaccharide biosynthesis